MLPLPNLKSLYLSRNRFVGDQVDLSWSHFPFLVDLNVSRNGLWGPLTVGAASSAMGILDASGNRWACFLPEFPSGMRVLASCSLFQRSTPLVRVMWRCRPLPLGTPCVALTKSDVIVQLTLFICLCVVDGCVAGGALHGFAHVR
jgi:hypothetical protein